MGWEVDEKAAEAGGAEANSDGEEVFFAAAATVEEDEGGVVFDTGGREGEAALLELGAQKGAALVEGACKIRATEQGGGAVTQGEGRDGDAVGGGGVEDDLVVVLEGAAGGTGDFAGGEPGGTDPNDRHGDEEPWDEAGAPSSETRGTRVHWMEVR